jgi:hypothetical protein
MVTCLQCGRVFDDVEQKMPMRSAQVVFWDMAGLIFGSAKVLDSRKQKQRCNYEQERYSYERFD